MYTGDKVSEDFREELKRLIEGIKSEVDTLIKKVEELRSRGEFLRAYRVWTEGVINILKNLSESFERLGAYARKYDIPEAQLRESLEYLRGELRVVLARIEESARRLKEHRRRALGIYFTAPDKVFQGVATILGSSIEEAVDSINKLIVSLQDSLSQSISRLTEVVSVRMRKKELEVIDQLVDSGIFKSRSEAIAYFVKRGVESSREWIEKALDQAKKIRELQESIRKDLGDIEEEENKS